MEITKIEKTKKGRYAIFIDGEFSFSLFSDQLYSEKLKVGTRLSLEEKDAIYKRSMLYFLKIKALSLLGKHAYTEKQLYDKLITYAPENNEFVLEICKQMKDVGFIDDECYAQAKAEYFYKYKGYGKYRIYTYLTNKGIAPDAAKNACDILEPADNIARITKIIEKKYEKKFLSIADGKSFSKAKASVLASIVRMGYSFLDAKTALLNYLEDNNISYK